jgi:phosphoserine phosphatase
MNEIFLINISGRDKPGLTSSLASVLADYNARVLDIGQAVVHETLTLGILIELPAGKHFDPIKKDLLARAHELDLQIRFSSISDGAFQHWVHAQGKHRFIITVLGRSITAQQLARVSTVISTHGLNIDRIERLSGRLSLAGQTPQANACIEFQVTGERDSTLELRAALVALAHESNIDIAFQRESIFRRNRRLVVFDMDSTLIQAEVIDELAKLHGVGDEVAKITAAAMRGELDFKQSFTKRVGLLRGLPEKQARGVLQTVPLVEGAERLISTLKKLGYKTAILSGGFEFFGQHLQSRLGIDYVFANPLQIIDGAVTGQVGSEIVDGAKKAELLQEIARRENISLDQVIAVGDGANDLPMLGLAGMGIAFHAKPVVRENASHAVSYLGLDSILYLIGVRDRDLQPLEIEAGRTN